MQPVLPVRSVPPAQQARPALLVRRVRLVLLEPRVLRAPPVRQVRLALTAQQVRLAPPELPAQPVLLAQRA